MASQGRPGFDRTAMADGVRTELVGPGETAVEPDEILAIELESSVAAAVVVDSPEV